MVLDESLEQIKLTMPVWPFISITLIGEKWNDVVSEGSRPQLKKPGDRETA